MNSDSGNKSGGGGAGGGGGTGSASGTSPLSSSYFSSSLKKFKTRQERNKLSARANDFTSSRKHTWPGCDTSGGSDGSNNNNNSSPAPILLDELNPTSSNSLTLFWSSQERKDFKK